MQRLQGEGVACAAIDITAIGTSDITPEEWYAGVIDSIVSSLNLYDTFDLDEWWPEQSLLSIVQRFSKFIETVLLKSVLKKLVIFVDEIDSILSLNFNIDDFFAVIRECYNKRVDNSDYRRLTFALIGVATPSDLIRDKRRTPFNIGRAIELTGFQLGEAQPLAVGLGQKADNLQEVLREVLAWTGGQPFLTQKLCKLVLNSPFAIASGSEAEVIEQLVRSRIIENWESQDEPEHLRTIRDRILSNEQRTSRLLGLYQQILQQGEVVVNDSPEQIELRLSGLVVKQEGKLKVYNHIYQSIFNLNWVSEALNNLRPYGFALAIWEASHREDESYLLHGQALQDAWAWAADKSLSTQDFQFLTASEKASKKKANEILNQIVWELVSPLSVEEVSPQLGDLIKRLQQVSGDYSLTLLNIKAGSTILFLEGSQKGFDHIRSLFIRGQLTQNLGIPVENVESKGSAPRSLAILLSRYPFLYPHYLLKEGSSVEARQTIQQLQIQKQRQFEVHLSHYVTYLVRRIQIENQNSSTTGAPTIQPVRNPTLLSDRELFLALKQFVGKVESSYTYRELAQCFLTHSCTTQSYLTFKDDLYEYLITSIEPEYGRHQFNERLYKQIKNTFPQFDSQKVDDLLLVTDLLPIIQLLSGKS
jgi:hypothetical protein